MKTLKHIIIAILIIAVAYIVQMAFTRGDY